VEERLLRVKQVLEIVPISRSAWFDGIQRGIYPQGFLLTQRTRVWTLSSILALIPRNTQQAAE
jgi:predicted DNA-binding transcriptional regulator AlpA